MIGTFGAQARDAKKLVQVGLWVETPTGYQFHEWEQMQPTKAEVLAERAKNKERQRAFRERHRNGVTDDVTNDVTNPASNAAPTRPDPFLKEKDLKRTPPTATPTRFAEFWEWYPRKVGKPDAKTAYKKAAAKVDEQVIIDGIERYRLDPNLPPAKYIPYPAKWLNQESWDDGPCAEQLVPADRPSGSQLRLVAGYELLQQTRAEQNNTHQQHQFEIEES
jgi:hypothetical protein